MFSDEYEAIYIIYVVFTIYNPHYIDWLIDELPP